MLRSGEARSIHQVQDLEQRHSVSFEDLDDLYFRALPKGLSLGNKSNSIK